MEFSDRVPRTPFLLERRAFMTMITGGLLAAPLAVEAQQAGKVWRVGFLSGGPRTPDGAPPPALRQALQELGYVEQQNVIYVGRWAEAKRDRLPGLAAELVGLNVDVIVTVGGPASEAAKQTTSSIPIVLAIVGDADGIGLIESLARPGGNVTGLTDQSVELSAKRLEILTEVVPKATRIAVLWNADDLGMTMRYREVEKAARARHVTVQPLGVREPDDFNMAFSAMTAQRPDALFLVTDALTALNDPHERVLPSRPAWPLRGPQDRQLGVQHQGLPVRRLPRAPEPERAEGVARGQVAAAVLPG